MQVRVLGCSGAIARDCRTTSFLVDDDLLVDAGTGVGDLTLEQMAGIDDVLLTHSHLDHIAALPLMIDAIASRRAQPLRVHALRATIEALRAHVFNNVIWPDFASIPSREAPFVSFHDIAIGQTLQLGARRPKAIEVLPAVHTVPACGFAVRCANGQGPHWVFSGDTERNPPFWDRVNALDVAMLVIETAFSDR
ncbi:MAG TPA: 3',5'-cyclic-nucleotide phosphodiesterase, partial [Variovorax sp.]